MVAVEEEFAGGRYVETAENVHRRRLARARRPHHRNEIAGVDVEIDTLQGLKRGLPRSEGLGDSTQRYERLVAHCAARWPVITSMPGFRSFDVTAVLRPSLAPVTTSMGDGSPSLPIT